MFNRFLLTVVALALLPVHTACAADAAAAEKAKQAIAVLQSKDASLFEAARACQQLGEIGEPDAVPVLARFLTDPKISAYARSGLENIPDPSAAAALRDAAKKLSGPLLCGVVNSLGTLRDPLAVELLAKFATDPASGVVGEALLALGNIATPEAIVIVEKALDSGPDGSRSQAAAALLLAADRQRTGGGLKSAIALYDRLRQRNIPTTYRIGATRGAILARQADRVPFLMEQLRSGEMAIRNAAVYTIREIPGDALASALNAELAAQTPEMQVQLLLAIGDCHNAQSIAAVQALDRSPDAEVRKTALLVLGRIGPDAAPALLAALRQDRPAAERAVAVNGLRSMEAPGIDELILEALKSADTPGTRVDLIRLLDTRGTAKAVPEIRKLAGAGDKNVSIAAFAALKSMAGPDDVPALIALVKSSGDGEVRNAAENALAGVCGRSDSAASEVVLAELKKAVSASERNGWIRVLGQVGYRGSLPAIETAAADVDASVADTALTQLGQWPSPEPMECLLKAIESGASPALRTRALRSAIDLAATAVDEKQVPDQVVVSWLQPASKAAQTAEDKRRILGLLGRLKTIESFRILASYLEDPALQTEAASGIIQIAPEVAKGEDAAAVKSALEKTAATVSNPDLKNRALAIAKTITSAQ